jgi:hypothetical protein
MSEKHEECIKVYAERNRLREVNKSLLEAAKEALQFFVSLHYTEDRPEGASEIETKLFNAIAQAEKEAQ